MAAMVEWLNPRRVAAGFMLALFLIVSVELGLRARTAWNTHIVFAEDGLFRYPIQTQVGPTPIYRTNNAGFFGPDLVTPKPEGVYRVVILGSSAVAEPSLPAAITEALQRRMPDRVVEAATAGLPRYTSYQTALLFERVVAELEPDSVIVYLGLNDNVYNTFPGQGEQPYDGYYNPADFSRSLLADMIWYQAVTKRFHVQRHFENTPSTAYYEAHLTNIIETANRHDIRVILSPIVCAWPTSDPDLARTIQAQEGPMSHFWGARDAALEGVAAHRSIMETLAERYELPLCDLAPALPRNGEIFRDFCHFTPAGIETFGEALAQCIAPATPPAESE
jgi:lysophospholipase L1-like esterase